eukprot:scaffold32801_cov31-Tisochrysis_lutea.AAC.4
MGAVAPLSLDIHRAFAHGEAGASTRSVRVDGVVERALGPGALCAPRRTCRSNKRLLIFSPSAWLWASNS